MFIQDALASEGWRRTGTINVMIIMFCGLTLLGCLLANIYIYPTRSVSQGRIVYHGDCTRAAQLDTLLHLMINIFSTGVLASSNFFMQVVSAPSRQEINRAHRLLCALEIGVPSMKNLFFLSPFKLFIWTGLLLSSTPIHLLFNSAVYETNYEGSEWNLTIATDAFVTGGAPYFGPGASLANSGSPLPNSTEETFDQEPVYFSSNGGWGQYISLADYWDNSTAVNQSISSTAREAGRWNNLTSKECWDEYRFCKARKQLRNMVLVVNAGSSGWMRSQVVQFNQTLSNDSLADWDMYVPPNVTNSLWFSAMCSNARNPPEPGSYDSNAAICTPYSQCGGALGDSGASTWVNKEGFPDSGTWDIPFQGPYLEYLQGDQFVHGDQIFQDDQSELSPEWPGVSGVYTYNASFNNLEVAYCLAEPTDYKCKVGVSNILLLVVVICTLIKVALCTLVVWKLPDTSLVTLGDALESFIAKPDPRTLGLGTVNATDSHCLEHRKRQTWEADELVSGPRPREWRYTSRRFRTVIPKEAWVRTYGILSAGVVLLAVALGLLANAYGPSTLTGAFGSSDDNIAVNIFLSPPTYTILLIAANSPQIILSMCYFSFNAFFTRTQTESEWSSYSLSYKPLRVTIPRGEQTSTYRLQLPYKYSLPLLAISVLLHWILSNAIFLFVVEGGFWAQSDSLSLSPTELGVSEDAFMALGVSGKALLIMLVISALLCFVPIIFSHRKVPGSMVSGGSDSLVLSAACHASVLLREARGGTEPSNLDDGAPSSESHPLTQPPPSATCASGRTRWRHTSSPEGFEEPLTPHEHWTAQEDAAAEPMMGAQLREDGERMGLTRVMSAEEREEHELSLLKELTLGKVKWGAMAVDPDLLRSLNLDGIDRPVRHLGFGGEEDGVEAPREGELYI